MGNPKNMFSTSYKSQTVLFIIIVSMISCLYANKSYSKMKKIIAENKSFEDSCEKFHFDRSGNFLTTCNNKNFKVNLDECLEFAHKAIEFNTSPEEPFSDSCSKYKIKTMEEGGKKRYFFEAVCFHIPEDEDLDEEEVSTLMNLNDFLTFDGTGVKCVDKRKIRFLTSAPRKIDGQCGKFSLKAKILAGSCNINGSPQGLSTDINACTGNSNSYLQRGGDFMKSCESCKVKNNGKINILSCTCKDGRNRTRNARTPLHDLVMFHNGRLECYDQAKIAAEEKAAKDAERRQKKKAERKKKEEEEKKRKEAEEAERKKKEEEEKKKKK